MATSTDAVTALNMALNMVRADVAEGRAHPGRAGWAKRRAAKLAPTLIPAARAARADAATNAYAEASRSRRAAEAAAWDAHVMAIFAGPAATVPTRTWFCKGCASVFVPVGTVAVTDSESSWLFAYGQDREVLAAWRAVSDGPETWAVVADVSQEARRAYGLRSVGSRTAAERLFGRSA